MAVAVCAVESTPESVLRTSVFSLLPKRLLLGIALISAFALLAIEVPANAYAASPTSAIVNTAANQLGKPYRWGAEGMRAYDCSGLVYRAFAQNGLLNQIGGNRKTARGYWRWFRERGLASKSNPRIGDLIIWGNGSHMGIYVGDGMAISALVTGVTRHRIGGINLALTAYLHTRL